MATIHITLVISHRGKFESGEDGKLAYVGGEKTEIERLNVDTLNMFFIADLVKDIGYTDVSELYWLQLGKELDGGLKLLRFDMDVVKLYEAAIANGRRVELFTEHPINLPELVEGNEAPEPEVKIVNVTRSPVKHRSKLCVSRKTTPKKRKEAETLPKKSDPKASNTHLEGDDGPELEPQKESEKQDKDPQSITKSTQQPEMITEQPNVPTQLPKVTFQIPETTIQPPDIATQPNLLTSQSPLTPSQPLEKTPSQTQPTQIPTTSEEIPLHNTISAESAAPTVVNFTTESVEILSQYIPQPCIEPNFHSQDTGIKNQEPTPDEGGYSSASQPEQTLNTEVGEGSRKKRKRRSTTRPPPTGQTFIPNQDPDKHPLIFIPVEDEDNLEPGAGLHCYESEEPNSIASDDEDSQQAAFPQGNVDALVREVRLEVCMEFENLDQFKKAVRKFNINLDRSIFFPRIDSTRCKAICYDEDCPWQIYCAKRSYPLSFQVKTIVNEHTCSRDNKNKSANAKWVIDELEAKIRDQPDMTVRQAEDFFKKEYDVIVNERKIYRAMVKAREKIKGSEIAQYAMLRDYANEVLRTNLGSTVRISTNYADGSSRGYTFV